MSEQTDSPSPWFLRIPSGIYWTLLALIVLALVFGYDRREQSEALDHVQIGCQLEEKELYEQALTEYKQALDNSRLARKVRGEVALKMADIYFTRFEDFQRAQAYYLRARNLDPKLGERANVQERMKSAKQRATGSGVTQGATTSTIIQHIELISQPLADKQGPVLASLPGREVRAGEIGRALAGLQGTAALQIMNDPKQFQQFLEQYVGKALIYQAAVDAGLHHDPDVSALLYDYQRTLLSERYLLGQKQKSQTLTNEQVKLYYNKNKDKFADPGRVAALMIKSRSEKDAARSLEKINSGMSFADVASSESIDMASAKIKGVVGYISEQEGFIPGVGKAPEVVAKLMTLNLNEVTSVTQIAGSFYMFKVVNKVPRRERPLDEVRSQVEAALHDGDNKSSPDAIAVSLRQKYQTEIFPQAFEEYKSFAERFSAQKATRSQTTATAQTIPPPEAGKSTPLR
ncbi:MAG: peptidylprolyl isomerase [bacterium]